MDFGYKVRLRREKLGWTQTELAKAIGLTQNRISKIESGELTQLSFKNLRALARTLGVSVDWLLGTWDDIEQVPAPKSEDAAAP
jgi:transcriptional regulator with XRE-family HTH domain